jgi:murein DD-endopeptidase MepM/ murein hydrolase activator NlpD
MFRGLSDAGLRTAALLLAVSSSPCLSFAVPSSSAPTMLASTGQETFVYPLMGPRLSSDYGNRRHPIKRVTQHHHGIDLAAPAGAPIRAIADGRVMFADPYAGYGKLVVVQHKNGLTSHYGHCSRIAVQPGAFVRAGDIIGMVGSTGISTGPHLHFELRKEGSPVNPERVLPGLADAAQG